MLVRSLKKYLQLWTKKLLNGRCGKNWLSVYLGHPHKVILDKELLTARQTTKEGLRLKSKAKPLQSLDEGQHLSDQEV